MQYAPPPPFLFMFIEVLKSKIHRVTVTDADLNYIGSITIDRTLMEAAGLIEYEKVQILNNNNGERFETYVIAGERDSGTICLNGAAARRVQRATSSSSSPTPRWTSRRQSDSNPLSSSPTQPPTAS